MLSSRLLSAAILISSVLVFVFADAYQLFGATAGLFLLPVHLFMVVGTAYEFASMLRQKHPVSRFVCVSAVAIAALIGTVPVLYAAFMGKAYPADCPIGIVGWSSVGFFVSFFLLVLDSMKHYRETSSDVSIRLAQSVLVLAYCGLLSHFLLCIRLSPASYSGLIVMVGCIMTIKMSDAGAYFTGRAIGKRPLDPIISPKKTREGAIGGIIVSGLVAWLFFMILKPHLFGSELAETQKLPWWGPLVAGVLIAVVSLIGDLLESVIKRSCGVKDSSRLLPGLGGIWDVTDSLFFAAPVAYLCILAGLIG